MKSECAYTRKRLERYLHGHLFKLQDVRITRHLASCPVCSSEFDAVRRVAETQRILRAVEFPHGEPFLARVGAALLGAARRVVYRPLVLTALVLSVVAVHRYVISPILHDPDLERLGASVQQTDPSAPPAPPPAVAPAAVPQPAASPAPGLPAADPLVVTITLESEQERASIRKINDAMKEHALLRTMRFSETVREISGSLTAHELSTFFNRVGDAGKISFKRSRLAAAGAGELLPFVVRLRVSPPAAAQPVDKPGDTSGEKSAGGERPAGAGVQNPVQRHADTPVEKPAEKPAVRTAPTESPAP